MSSINFACRYCRKTNAITAARILHATFVRCDSCYAVNAFSASQRMALIQGAKNSAQGPGEQALKLLQS